MAAPSWKPFSCSSCWAAARTFGCGLQLRGRHLRCGSISDQCHFADAAGATLGGTYVFVGTHWRKGLWRFFARKPDRLIYNYTTFHPHVTARTSTSPPGWPTVEYVFMSDFQRRILLLKGEVHASPLDIERFVPVSRPPVGPVVVGRMSRDLRGKIPSRRCFDIFQSCRRRVHRPAAGRHLPGNAVCAHRGSGFSGRTFRCGTFSARAGYLLLSHRRLCGNIWARCVRGNGLRATRRMPFLWRLCGLDQARGQRLSIRYNR